MLLVESDRAAVMRKNELGLWLESLGFVPEHPFRGRSGKRRWRFDWALPADLGGGIACEYNGLGAHTTYVTGTFRDMEKVTEAQLCGWLVVQCNVETTRDGRCQSWIEEALEKKT